MTQWKIPAVYMRGGTSKGVFFRAEHVPADPALRDPILLRVIGSPDPYEKQIDGMGGATSSTSKVVIVGPATRADCDVDYLFGAVSIDTPVIDWSGNCGNLTSAVGPFAIAQGYVDAPRDGVAVVRIWQVNLGAVIVAHVPMRDGEVVEEGDFELDGVTFPAAEVKLEFLHPGGTPAIAPAGDDPSGGMFPTGHPVDLLEVPGHGTFRLTMINAGNPAIFMDARDLGLRGNEMQADVNGDPALLAKCEAIRAHAAVRMGLGETAADVTARRPATPKLAFVAPPSEYVASSGRRMDPARLDINARILSMGRLHHAMTGTGAVALAVAGAIPGTVVHGLVGGGTGAGVAGAGIRFGHPSGALTVGAEARCDAGVWTVTKAIMSRSARRLMEGHVLVPAALRDAVALAAPALVAAAALPATPEIRADLAPGGRLRAAINYGNPILAARHPVSGAPTGVSVDLAKQLAALTGLRLDVVPYDGAGKVVDGLARDEWDVAFVARDPVRGAGIAQTAPYIIIEGAYLVREDSPIRANEQVDRAGIHVVVGRGSAYDLFLTRTLEHAAITRAATSQAVVDTLLAGEDDVAAGVRQQLESDAARVPGLRLLDGRFMVIEQAMGTPHGRPLAFDYVSRFLRAMLESGFVQRALEAHGIRGATVAPPPASASAGR